MSRARLGWGCWGGWGGAVLAALAACRPAAPAGGQPPSTDHVLLPPSYMFKPAAITVTTGTRVTWKNTDHFTHSVRLLDDGDSVMILKPGDSTSFAFTRVGMHRYDCSFHPRDMHGEVVVTGEQR